MKNNVILPESRKRKFTCPHCKAISSQLWGNLSSNNMSVPDSMGIYRDSLRGQSVSNWGKDIAGDGVWLISCCENCRKICIWKNEQMVYPKIIVVDEPNEDLPEDIKSDYWEAASILRESPRGAAALLRLCIQKLCKHLGKKGKNLNDDIGELVKDGLSEKVQKAMDLLRVTGDNSVHPGELDMTDNTEIATNLFGLVNFIAEKMITEPKEVDSFYENIMPESAKEAVERRRNRK